MPCFLTFLRPLTLLVAFAMGIGLVCAAPPASPEPAPSDTPPERPVEVIFADVVAQDMKAGYNLRSDTWNGNLPQGETKPIPHQFFKGNYYHFYVTTDVKGAKMSVHIYDKDGNLAEDRSWQKPTGNAFFAGAEIQAKSTGSYFLILRVDESPEKETTWAMAYSYK